jgi:hypothetical protein
VSASWLPGEPYLVLPMTFRAADEIDELVAFSGPSVVPTCAR